MKPQDIRAINAFDPQNNVYISVIKDENGDHLEETSTPSWTPASIHVVKSYIDAHPGVFENPPPELQQDKLAALRAKIQPNSFLSFFSALCAKICALFSCLFCCKRKTPEPEKPPVHKSTPLPSEPEKPPIHGSNPIHRLWSKFKQSIVKPPSIDAQDLRALFAAECSRLLKFLKTPPSIEADLVYICMGHGGVAEQIWPGFVLKRLQEEESSVHTMLFEHSTAYGEYPPPHVDLIREYGRYPNPNGKLLNHLDRFSVDQFLCGLPRSDEIGFDEVPEAEKYKYAPGFIFRLFWDTKAHLQEAQRNFKLYIKALLEQGKQVALGDHSGWLVLEDPLVDTYNDLIQQYPNQLYFLWGWDNVNRITNQPIGKKDIDPKSLTSIWTFYPEKEGGLNRCQLP